MVIAMIDVKDCLSMFQKLEPDGPDRTALLDCFSDPQLDTALDSFQSNSMDLFDWKSSSMDYQQRSSDQPSSESTSSSSSQNTGISITHSSDHRVALKTAKSEAAKERRRERNKLLARKTRQRKKMELDLMRDQMLTLMLENERLRAILLSNVPSMPTSSILESDMGLPQNILEMVHKMITNHERAQFNEISIKQRSFVVVNPHANDQPIVYASPGFLELTGYRREEVIGRNCRMLQGPDTDPSDVEQMCNAIEAGEDTSVVLLNYRKDGSAFWNNIDISHLRDGNGKVSFIVGLQTQCGPHCLRSKIARSNAIARQQVNSGNVVDCASVSSAILNMKEALAIGDNYLDLEVEEKDVIEGSPITQRSSRPGKRGRR